MSRLKPHPKNVPGDFYVEDGCCTACDLPRVEAPEHFKYEGSHCYVCRQPETEEQIVKVINALEVQDLDCIMYQGSDPKVLKELKKRKLQNCIVNNDDGFAG